jgi:hypothetical protein
MRRTWPRQTGICHLSQQQASGAAHLCSRHSRRFRGSARGVPPFLVPDARRSIRRPDRRPRVMHPTNPAVDVLDEVELAHGDVRREGAPVVRSRRMPLTVDTPVTSVVWSTHRSLSQTLRHEGVDHERVRAGFLDDDPLILADHGARGLRPIPRFPLFGDCVRLGGHRAGRRGARICLRAEHPARGREAHRRLGP